MRDRLDYRWRQLRGDAKARICYPFRHHAQESVMIASALREGTMSEDRGSKERGVVSHGRRYPANGQRQQYDGAMIGREPLWPSTRRMLATFPTPCPLPCLAPTLKVQRTAYLRDELNLQDIYIWLAGPLRQSCKPVAQMP
jgi:hypothetical protein